MSILAIDKEKVASLEVICPFWRVWWLQVTLLLFVGTVSSPPVQFECRNGNSTCSCIGCSHLPTNLPPGVSRIEMIGDGVSPFYFPTNVLPEYANVKSVFINNYSIPAVRSGDLSSFENAMIISLSNNGLKYIDEYIINSNKNLKRLLLNDNPELQPVPIRSESLTELYLQNSGPSSFDPQLLQHLPDRGNLYITGSDKLHCSQESENIRKHYPDFKAHCSPKKKAATINSTTTTTESKAPSNVNYATENSTTTTTESKAASNANYATKNSTTTTTESKAPSNANTSIIWFILLPVVFFAILAGVFVFVVKRLTPYYQLDRGTEEVGGGMWPAVIGVRWRVTDNV
ncbi:uncharacterized protein LOC126094985 [Schistocerca cancellata]|uniref:uncharacterized protein LOC126094985 n=1 Tax=Schistocerca cancellata TaxID=274614 RepID=UPI0021191FAD|nr:uncharacterized protein LOC126094985 [Schistocerca cancellata]